MEILKYWHAALLSVVKSFGFMLDALLLLLCHADTEYILHVSKCIQILHAMFFQLDPSVCLSEFSPLKSAEFSKHQISSCDLYVTSPAVSLNRHPFWEMVETS